jgi:hypothetical protein
MPSSSGGPTSSTFGVEFSNLPIINVREEFAQYLKLLHDPQFCAGLLKVRQPVELPTLTWRGLPKDALTYMLQRAILGVEACISAAVDYELHLRQMITPKISGYMEDPNTAPGPRGTAQMYYNNLPAIVDPSYALKTKHPALWERVRRFYHEVRNPLFHGYQLHNPRVDSVIPLFEMLSDLYVWMDSWWRAFR